jgi:hypothetical protein
MTKLNSLARARVIGPEGGAEDDVAGAGVGEGAAGVDVLVVSSLDGVVTLADFAVFLHFALALLRYIFKTRRGSGVRDILSNVILQQTTWVSAITPSQSVLRGRGHHY